MCRSYDDQCEILLKNKQDASSYLKKQLEFSNEQVFDLNDRLTGLQQVKDNEKDLFEKTVQTIKEKCLLETEKFENENMLLRTRLVALEDFEYQRQSMEKIIDDLKCSILQKEDAYKKALEQMEIALILFKNRLKKEAIEYLNDLAIEFHNSTRYQISHTIKQTINENVYLNSQIDYLSNQLEKYIAMNKKHNEDNQYLRRTVAVLEDVEMLSAKKNVATNYVIRVLSNKLREDQRTQNTFNENISSTEKTEKELTKIAFTQDKIFTQENQSDEINSLKEENHLLKEIIEQAAISIANVVQSHNGYNKTPEIEQRNDLLEQLLSILLTSHRLGQSGLQLNRRQLLKGIFPGSRLGLHRIPRGSSAKANTHYSPGDLGIIPHDAKIENKNMR